MWIHSFDVLHAEKYRETKTESTTRFLVHVPEMRLVRLITLDCQNPKQKSDVHTVEQGQSEQGDDQSGDR